MVLLIIGSSKDKQDALNKIKGLSIFENSSNNHHIKPVSIVLDSKYRKIHNMTFSLNFMQTEAVSDTRLPAVYTLYFSDMKGNSVSSYEKIVADNNSGNPQDRMIKCIFNLKSIKYDNSSSYFLNIVDENGNIIQQEEFEIDIVTAVDFSI